MLTQGWPPSNLSYSGVQPDHDKSASQSMMDKTGRASDREVHGGSAESMYAHTQTPNKQIHCWQSSSGDKFKGALGMDKHH